MAWANEMTGSDNESKTVSQLPEMRFLTILYRASVRRRMLQHVRIHYPGLATHVRPSLTDLDGVTLT
jgi:hypothetical protein